MGINGPDRSREAENNTSSLRFHAECTGAIGPRGMRQIDMLLLAYDTDNRAVGYIEYVLFDGAVHIHMIQVAETLRRQGIATAMYSYLKTVEEKDKPIEWGTMTDDGWALFNAVEGDDKDIPAELVARSANSSPLSLATTG